MNFERKWIRRDRPQLTDERPVEAYAESVDIYVDEEQDLDMDLKQYVRRGPVQILEKPMFMTQDGTHLKGRVPAGRGKSYKIIIEDRGE